MRLAFLLLGATALRRQWLVLAAAGLIWLLCGVGILIDISDGRLSVIMDVLAVFLIVEGAVEIGAAVARGLRRNWSDALRGLGFLFTAFVVFDVPWDNNIAAAVLFGLAFLFDGVLRLVSALLVHAWRWRMGIVAGLVEIALAAVILLGSPLPHRLTVPFCFALLLITSGYTLLRMALQLRGLSPGMSVTALPLFAARNWHARGLVPAEAPHDRPEHGLLHVHVWTPVGSATNPERRMLVDRYVAAVDGKGVISTGHSALEMPPDLYISHYPAVEIDHSESDFRALLSAGRQNDVPGRFQPSLAVEAAGWCMPNRTVTFRRFNEPALRAFWKTYSANDTYNLTARNCSSTVLLALDAAIEGAVGDRGLWRGAFRLISDPHFWLLRMVRGRAEAMTWTPGLVLDYSSLLQLVVDHGERRWRTRLTGALAARRALVHDAERRDASRTPA
ncbi:HdeD family acid-resistance protein [Hansschlegelia sp. KR7-227]|uniref:HdeD family acid-resistance protein n=1 Tax=Hansschlegelia sp. KR7-227 TaxID=3400914 RepID=UPI003C0BD64E